MRMWFVLAAVAALAAAAPPVMADNPPQMQIDALMAKWLWAIGHEYVEGYADCYWPDATVLTYDASGQVTTLTGVKAIRQRQQEWSDQTDFSKVDLAWPEPTRFVPSAGDVTVYVYMPKQFPGINVFYYQRRGTETRILRQIELGYTR